MASRLKAPSVRTRCPCNGSGNPEHLKILEASMKSYKPEELFDGNGKLIEELAGLAPTGRSPDGRKSAREWRAPADCARSAGRTITHSRIPGPGQVVAEAPRRLGDFLRDVFKLNPTNFRPVLPDRDKLQPLANSGATRPQNVALWRRLFRLMTN